jgi:hypothetical protein
MNIQPDELDRTFNKLMEDIFLEEQTRTVERALIDLASDSTVQNELPDIVHHLESYLLLKEKGDTSELEIAFIELYIKLHTAGSGYTSPEKELLKEKSGISCLPGGISPLIMARQFIGPKSTVADLGAGNGLQGLLLQRISPHRKTMQIEISAGMVRMGRVFQHALGIGEDHVEWINGDMANVSLEPVDFIYMYRPAKPHEGGNELYRAIARKLSALRRPIVVFSVADCLGRFLDKRFEVFYDNGYLTCFCKE